MTFRVVLKSSVCLVSKRNPDSLPSVATFRRWARPLNPGSALKVEGDVMSTESRSTMVISPLWMQGMVLTLIVGFAILGYLAMRVYQDHAPIPGRVVSEQGKVIFTRDDILSGQQSFLTYGLMQFGSVYGHGAYLGPDFTADYLHRQALAMQQLYGGGAGAQERVQRELQINRYDPVADTITWTDGQVRAFEGLRRHYEDEILN